MKNKDLFELREALNEVDHIKGKTFAFAVFKNKQMLDAEIEAINSIKKDPGEKYTKYEQERTSLCALHSEKDDNGQPLLDYSPSGQQSFRIKDMPIFEAEYQKLAEQNKEMLDALNENKIEFDTFLEKDADITLKTISINDLPEDINAGFLDKIAAMIE